MRETTSEFLDNFKYTELTLKTGNLGCWWVWCRDHSILAHIRL